MVAAAGPPPPGPRPCGQHHSGASHVSETKHFCLSFRFCETIKCTAYPAAKDRTSCPRTTRPAPWPTLAPRLRLRQTKTCATFTTTEWHDLALLPGAAARIARWPSDPDPFISTPRPQPLRVAASLTYLFLTLIKRNGHRWARGQPPRGHPTPHFPKARALSIRRTRSAGG